MGHPRLPSPRTIAKFGETSPRFCDREVDLVGEPRDFKIWKIKNFYAKNGIIYKFQEVTPEIYVEKKLSEGLTPFGILTGSHTQDEPTVLNCYERGKATVEEVKSVFLFETKVEELLINGLDNDQLFPYITGISHLSDAILKEAETLFLNNQLNYKTALNFSKKSRREFVRVRYGIELGF